MLLDNENATAAVMRGGEMDLEGEVGVAAKGAAVRGGGWEGIRHG